MECETIEEELVLFNEICIENDSESDNDNVLYSSKPVPRPPLEPKISNRFMDFEKYIEEKCENKIRILDRATFHQIKRPIMLCFNHFREKCFYHTKYLDRLYELALKYGDQIEFIAADQMDMDVIYPHTNPIRFYCCLVSPENESLTTFIIDEKKQIFQHYDAYQTVETFSESCDKLLNGTLYISQPIPKENYTLVKIAVHLNYDELVTKSSKDILLIVGLGEYKTYEEYEPNYEQISEELRDSNVEIVYIDGDKNYIPFELNANCYPTIIFIPHSDKEKFVHFSKCPRDTAMVLEFIKENIGPQGETLRRNELSKYHFKPFSLPSDYELEFQDLHHYLSDNFPKSLNVMDRTTFRDPKQCVIIYFMDFKEKGVSFYLETLKTIHQVAEQRYNYGIVFLVADIKDIDIIYPKWYKKYLVDPREYLDIPKVFAIDRSKHTYEVNGFATVSSLTYFCFDLIYSKFFYSQPWRMTNNSDLVTTCVAHNLKELIKKSKSDIFLTIYRSTYTDSHHILNILDEIADDSMRQVNVKMFKMDAQHNYVPLEYSYPTYPVYFFISCRDKEKGTTRYIGSHESKDDLLAFIRENREQNA